MLVTLEAGSEHSIWATVRHNRHNAMVAGEGATLVMTDDIGLVVAILHAGDFGPADCYLDCGAAIAVRVARQVVKRWVLGHPRDSTPVTCLRCGRTGQPEVIGVCPHCGASALVRPAPYVPPHVGPGSDWGAVWATTRLAPDRQFTPGAEVKVQAWSPPLSQADLSTPTEPERKAMAVARFATACGVELGRALRLADAVFTVLEPEVCPVANWLLAPGGNPRAIARNAARLYGLDDEDEDLIAHALEREG